MSKQCAKDFVERLISEKVVYYLPFWPKAKTLVNHFKKIKDLELISKDSVSGF
jgi:hypothetical protein